MDVAVRHTLAHAIGVHSEVHQFRFAFLCLAALHCRHPLSVCTAAKGLSLNEWAQ